METIRIVEIKFNRFVFENNLHLVVFFPGLAILKAPRLISDYVISDDGELYNTQKLSMFVPKYLTDLYEDLVIIGPKEGFEYTVPKSDE